MSQYEDMIDHREYLREIEDASMPAGEEDGMKARRTSLCRGCHRTIAVGDAIKLYLGAWMHERCAEEADEIGDPEAFWGELEREP